MSQAMRRNGCLDPGQVALERFSARALIVARWLELWLLTQVRPAPSTSFYAAEVDGVALPLSGLHGR